MNIRYSVQNVQRTASNVSKFQLQDGNLLLQDALGNESRVHNVSTNVICEQGQEPKEALLISEFTEQRNQQQAQTTIEQRNQQGGNYGQGQGQPQGNQQQMAGQNQR